MLMVRYMRSLRKHLAILKLSPGNWIASTPIPEQSFDMREAQLKGEDHQLLLALVKKVFRWLPEERATAQDLTEDPFLTQFLKKT